MNVLNQESGESPSPFPSDVAATWGPTVSVFGTQIQVAKASITGPAGSVAIKVIYGDGQATDPNGFCNSSHACIIPVPLQASSTYAVHLEGTQAGTPFSRDFAFSTH